MSTTTVINLFGGPGCGKSTLAAELFYRIKTGGTTVELVREYIKDWAWENRKATTFDQPYILGNQLRRESLLYKKVPIIVTDSPLLLCPMYHIMYSNQAYTLPTVLGHLELCKQSGIIHKNYVLIRNKEYDPAGRYENEEQAKAIDTFIVNFLTGQGVEFTTLSVPDSQKASTIIKDLMEQEHV